MARVIINEKRCKGCGLCIEVCPKKILQFDKSKLNEIGYHPVSVTDMSLCIGCCSCARMCPDVILEIEK